jgi:hypothetical protein
MHSSHSTEFDAYHKWLGIPPAEQPPHHYRLLGLTLFEDDAEVIAAAADRQMTHVKSFAAGRQGASAQALLNELARARVTLLNEQQKLAYDRRLKQSKDQPVASAPVRPAARIGTLNESSFEQQLSDQGQLSSPELDPWVVALRRSAKRQRSSLPAQLLLTAIILGLVGAVASLVVNRETAPPTVAAKETTRRRASATPTPRFQEPPTPTRRPVIAARPRTPFAPTAAEARVERSIAPSKPLVEKPAQPIPPIVQAGPTEIIDLNLENRRQVHQMANKATTRLRVTAVRGIGSAYVIPDERLDEKNNARIEIEAIRRVVIELSLRKNDDKALVVVDCGAINDEGNIVPLALPHIRGICAKIAKQGDRAVAALNSVQQEKTRLEAWIKSPNLKPLAAVRAARTRVMTLDILIRQAQQRVETLSADFQVAQQVEELAKDLHKSCKIELAEISATDSDEVRPEPTTSDRAKGNGQ